MEAQGDTRKYNNNLTVDSLVSISVNDRVFHSLYKVGRNGNFVFKGFNNNKKKLPSSGARPDATDYYWFRSPVPNQMS